MFKGDVVASRSKAIDKKKNKSSDVVSDEPLTGDNLFGIVAKVIEDVTVVLVLEEESHLQMVEMKVEEEIVAVMAVVKMED
ncbi:hypothetical protein RND71_042531 [Anisodus tanguticus]|uniref:Uncharacterized protein n=1 Tax=Anisodus tanguticus TaxID=243964 RepID=A0AAE1QRN6_9SOLA|nr:hypothetical protein RND71_042531 [Anisodus tanguticus]